MEGGGGAGETHHTHLPQQSYEAAREAAELGTTRSALRTGMGARRLRRERAVTPEQSLQSSHSREQ